MRPQLVVTDLDNTVWDWFHMWYQSFSAMLQTLEALTGLPSAVLEQEARIVHQSVGTTEYTFVLDEMPSLIKLARPRLPSQTYRAALAVRADVRRRETVLYPGVVDTLKTFKRKEVPVLAFTESNAYWTEWRIRKTGLDGLLTVLYSAPDQGFPEGLDRGELRRNPPAEYGLKRTIHRTTPLGYLKPDPHILDVMMRDYAVAPQDVLYVGDSLMKDVAMANSLGVTSALALYGIATEKQGYELLRRVTHWSDADVARERTIAQADPPAPTFTLDKGYWQLLDVCDV
jgi:FMN phosphatase YigB (HAD superfamily)